MLKKVTRSLPVTISTVDSTQCRSPHRNWRGGALVPLFFWKSKQMLHWWWRLFLGTESQITCYYDIGLVLPKEALDKSMLGFINTIKFNENVRISHQKILYKKTLWRDFVKYKEKHQRLSLQLFPFWEQLFWTFVDGLCYERTVNKGSWIQTGPQIRLDLELDLPADKYLFIATNRFTQNYCVDFMRF